MGIPMEQLPKRVQEMLKNPSSRADPYRNTPRPNKYHAVATYVDGHRFPSKKEAGRYVELCLEMRAKSVLWFCIQPQFPLEGGVSYKADFLVVYPDGRVVVEDVKGGIATRTKTFRLKKRQVAARYGIEIKET